MNEELKTRIAKNTTPNELTGCWNWNGSLNRHDGYGKLSINNRTYRAHRAMWMACFGEAPADKVVRHKCDNPRCVNPDHLELGSYAENTQDMISRGRAVRLRGAEHPSTSLTEEQARDIKYSGEYYADAAAKYGVSVWTVFNIRKGRSWSHL